MKTARAATIGLALPIALGVGVAACEALIGANFDSTLERPDPGASSEGGGDRHGHDGGADASRGDDASGGDGDSPAPRYAFCRTIESRCVCISTVAPGDGGACDETTFINGFCCAGADWPNGAGLDEEDICTCAAWRCHTTSSGECSCGPISDDAATATTCTGSFCCQHPTFATCGCADTQASACPSSLPDANNIPAASCTQPTMVCPGGGRRVASCSKLD